MLGNREALALGCIGNREAPRQTSSKAEGQIHRANRNIENKILAAMPPSRGMSGNKLHLAAM